MRVNPLRTLLEFGTSVWYDNISRDMLKSGELKRLMSEWGLRGITSNPTIFDNAISGGTAYDQQIAALKPKGLSTDAIFEELALNDIGEAADLFRPIYEESGGTDGFVSIEVSPLLAAETEATIREGNRLFERLGRPNIMIKVPGTREGLPAVRALLESGINVNITLLFSVENYVAVAKTYCDALRARMERGHSIDRIRSVASFFVSRVDTIIDKRLEKIAAENQTRDPAKSDLALSLRGQFGVANSRLAYQQFNSIFLGPNFAALKAKGAAVQRPLWASTGVKNPAYKDTMYVAELIGKDIVNTMPHQTCQAFADHGVVRDTIEHDIAGAKALQHQLLAVGVDIPALLEELPVDGVKKFSESFHSLNSTIAKKLG